MEKTLIDWNCEGKALEGFEYGNDEQGLIRMFPEM